MAVESAEKRCTHKEALQITKSSFQWCPNCGAGKREVKTAKGDTAIRWQTPALYQAKRGRAPKAVVSGTAGGRQPRAASLASVTPVKRGRPAAVASVTPMRRKTDKPAVIKATRSRRESVTVHAAHAAAHGNGNGATAPKRHRRTKAEMEAFRAEQAKALITPKRRVRVAKPSAPEVLDEVQTAAVN